MEFINNTTKGSSNLKKLANGVLCGFFGMGKELNDKVPKYSKNKALIGLTLFAGLIAGTTKATLLTANRTGSKEFKVDKKEFNGAKTAEDKKAYLQEKKRRSKGKFGSFLANNFRDGFTGAVNGLMMPITTLCGGLAGVPLYLAGNTLTRFFVGNKEEDDKSLAALGENLKNNAAETGVFALAAGIPLAIKAHNFSAFEKNFNKAVDKLSSTVLTKVHPDVSESKIIGNVFEDHFRNLYESSNLPSEEIAKKLVDDNLIISKFIQVSDVSFGRIRDVAAQMRDSIPPSRDIGEVTALLKNSTNAKLREATVEKCIGSATVAETYSVRYKDGTLDVVKIIRKGFDDAKVDRDLQECKAIIDKNFQGKPEMKEKLKKQLEVYAQSLKEELNLNNELQNAEKIAKSTKRAMVANPRFVETVNGSQIYVMEHARGMNLKSFCELIDIISEDTLRKRNISWLGGMPASQKSLDQVIAKMSQTPEEAKILEEKMKNLTEKDLEFFFEEIQNVVAEQFGAITQNGKAIHGDIHPGNMFVDLDAVKNHKKGQVFTLIDTGNAINLTAKEAENMLRLQTCIQKGDAEGVVRCFTETLEDSAFPAGKRKEIEDSVIAKMKDLFLNNKEVIEDFSKEGISDFVIDLFRKQNVSIASESVLQYNKAFNSANASVSQIGESLFKLRASQMNDNLLMGFAQTMNSAMNIDSQIKNVHSKIQS
ncbi:MAG: AarF/UbiB family protein, partial [Candidatus Gastranaerophilaceae bacterium]